MARPASPRAWVVWAFATLERFASPQSVRFGATPPGDRRLNNSRERALDVKKFLESSRNGCRGKGPRLLFQFYIGGATWEAFSPTERWLMRKVEKKFRAQLITAGFLPGKEQEA